MTALDHPTFAIDARTRAVAVVARVAKGMRALARALGNRRQVDRLADLSDHALNDIGLTRADLFVVMRTPVGVDPTSRLSALARERYTTEEAARRVC